MFSRLVLVVTALRLLRLIAPASEISFRHKFASRVRPRIQPEPATMAWPFDDKPINPLVGTSAAALKTSDAAAPR